MAGSGKERYPPEYRERMVKLVRAGRSPGSPARTFEPSGQTIRNWLKQADPDEGLQKAAAWFAMESGSIPSGGMH